MKKNLWFLWFLLVSSYSFSSEVTLFVKLSPSGSLEAKTKELSGRVAYDGGKVRAKKLLVLVDSLRTGIELRDEHLRKHLKYEKHPYISLYDMEGFNGKGSGAIEIAGVKKPVEFDYTVKDDNLIASFKINALDFNLKKVKYFNIGVDETVKIKVNIPVNNKETKK